MASHYEDDDRMLTRLMREAMPIVKVSPDFNKPKLTAAQRAQADAALARMGKPWIKNAP